MANILIVDDTESVRSIFNEFLMKNGHDTTQAESGEKALALIQKDIFDIALVDLKMGEMGGLDLLKTIKNISSDTEVIVITGHGTIDAAVESMRLGAYDFITKPVNMKELILNVEKAIEKNRLLSDIKALRTQVKHKYRFGDLIGNTASMLSVFELIKRVSQVDSTVLITGESGTGKDLVAQAIHSNSPRYNKPLVPVNCAAIPEEIQESELFGYIKGAFTDANEDREGLFESANGGTVFLDEIADASPSIQAKLLRFLEDGEIRRVGANKPIHTNVRIIAATSKDLFEAINNGIFRDDLYYRINVIGIHLPPLRERKEDIPILAQHFIQKYSQNSNKLMHHISHDALSIMMEYNWPGNVRELQNAIQHAITISQHNIISRSSLPSHIPYNTKNSKQDQFTLESIKSEYIIKVLEEQSWNYEKASKILGVGKTTVYRKHKSVISN